MNQIVSENASPAEICSLFNVSRESLEKFELYVTILSKWQKRINLVGPLELPRLWSRHIADGLQLVKHISRADGSIVDLGSGAGIPGIILAIALCDRGHHIHLVESNGKKAAFLREAARELDLPVDVHCSRIEALAGESSFQQVDVVVARALAPLPKLMDMAVPLVRKTGKMLFLKGLDVDSELTATTKCWNITYDKFPSRTHSDGCILEIKEFQRDPDSTVPGKGK